MNRNFIKSLASMPQVVSFVDEGLAAYCADAGTVYVLQLAVEEIFTNMVKYSKGVGKDVSISLIRADNRVTVTFDEYDVEPFDITALPEPDVTKPLAERKVGGLGIHLIKQMVDEFRYDYADNRTTITITKSLEH
jgi:anti-sigma regulatory factor (Ser/Thr protein kinase)